MYVTHIQYVIQAFSRENTYYLFAIVDLLCFKTTWGKLYSYFLFLMGHSFPFTSGRICSRRQTVKTSCFFQIPPRGQLIQNEEKWQAKAILCRFPGLETHPQTVDAFFLFGPSFLQALILLSSGDWPLRGSSGSAVDNVFFFASCCDVMIVLDGQLVRETCCFPWDSLQKWQGLQGVFG